MNDYIPKWHRELDIFHKIKPLIILEGNVLDVYQYPTDGSTPKGSILRLPEYLHYYLKDIGYENIAFYDSLRGFFNTCEDGYTDRFGTLVGASVDNGTIKSDFKGKSGASNIVRTALAQNREATAIIMNFASRYIISPDNLEQAEVDGFTVLLQSSLEGKDIKTTSGVLKNLLIMVVNKLNDVPVWFYHDNPNVKTISLATPSKEERELLVKGNNFVSFLQGISMSRIMRIIKKNPMSLIKFKTTSWH